MRYPIAGLMALPQIAHGGSKAIETTPPMANLIMVTDNAIHIIAAAQPVPKHAPGSDGGTGIRGVALLLQDADRDVHALERSLKESAVAIPTPLQKGHGAMQIADPSGNCLEFLSAP